MIQNFTRLRYVIYGVLLLIFSSIWCYQYWTSPKIIENNEYERSHYSGSAGKDYFIFHSNKAGHANHFDGQAGEDILLINAELDQQGQAKLMADFIVFYYRSFNSIDGNDPASASSEFHFTSIPLTIVNIEYIFLY